MTAPHDPHGSGGDRDFRQLTGAFDRPIAPSPNFAEALKRRMEEEESTMQHTPTAPLAPVSNRTARARAMPSGTGRRWLDVAIAAVLIVALLGGSFWYSDIRTGGDGPSAPQSTRYAAQPLSNTPVAAQEVKTDSGNTNAYPSGFDPKAEHEAQILKNAPPEFSWTAISGNTLVISGDIELSAPGNRLSAVNLITGELVWTSSVIPMTQFAVTDDMIFGAFRESASFDYAMSAVSLETGEMIWSGEPLMEQNAGLDVVSPIAPLNAFRPTVIDDMVYYVDRNGSVIALDAATGTEQWSMPLEHESTEPGWGRGGSVVGDEEYLYAVDAQNAIRKLDRLTGEEVHRFPLTDRPATAYIVDVHLQNNTLVAISRSLDYEGATAFVDAISTDDGQVLWSQRLGTVGPFITMTDDVVAIPHQVMETEIGNVSDDITEQGLYVSFFDLETGDPISLYGPSSAPGAIVSASGSVVCINEGRAITCVDMASETRTLVTLPYAPGEESIGPLLFWNETAIVLDVNDGVTLLQPTAEPQQAQSTDEPDARGSSFAWTSDRSLVNPDLDGPTKPLTLAWTHVVSDPMWTMPYGDVVASLGSSEIAVQDAATGEVLWSKPTDEAFRNTTYDTERNPTSLLGNRQGQQMGLPWIEGDTLYYAGTTDLIGVDVHTGEEVFRTIHTVTDNFRTLFFPWDMVVKDGTAFILTISPHGLYVMKAIDLASGDVIWSFDAGEWVADREDKAIWIWQPLVTDNLVIMQVWERTESSILALNIEDGSIAWEQDESLVGGRSDNSYSNISAIGNDYLVMTRRGAPTGTVDGKPNADQSLQIALYDLQGGEMLWMDTEGTFPNQESGLCMVVPGWDETSLYIPCSTDSTLTMFRYPFDGNGEVERLGTWQTPGPAPATIYDDEAAYFNTGTAIFRVELESGETSTIPMTGGESCMGLQASNDNILCIHDDNLGTYTIQAYAPAPSIATPQASPAVSNVERDAETTLLANDPGNTSAYPAGYDPAQSASVDGSPGDPRSTSAYPTGFDISAPLTAEPLGKNPPSATGGIIVGDMLIGERTSIIMEDPASFSPNGVYAQDLISGEVLWRSTERFDTRYTADASGVYGLTSPATASLRLVALDLDTGTERWRSEPLTGWSAYPEDAPNLPADKPLAVDGTVYVPFTDGSVVAFDGVTGDVLWQHEPEAVPAIDEYRSGASIVADERYLYASNAENTISVLERETGEQVNHIEPADLGGDQFWLTLHLQGDRLVLLGRNMGSGEPEGRITVLDAMTGERLWSAETGTVQSNVLVTPETVGVVHVEFDTANRLERLFGQETTGDIELSLFDLESGEAIGAPEGVVKPVDGAWQAALASSGNAICVSYTTVTCFDTDGAVTTVEGFETSHITTVGQQILIWDGTLVILDAREQTHIVKPDDARTATPVGTP